MHGDGSGYVVPECSADEEDAEPEDDVARLAVAEDRRNGGGGAIRVGGRQHLATMERRSPVCRWAEKRERERVASDDR